MNKYNELSKPKQVLISVTGLVAIVMIFVFTIYAPAVEEISGIESNNKILADEIQINSIKAKHLDKLKLENKNLEKMLHAAKHQLPQKAEIAELLQQITALGKNTNLEFKLWRPGNHNESKSKLYIEIPVNVEITGSYHSVGLFFDKLSRIARIVNISQISMLVGPRLAENKEPEILTSFTATAFALSK